MALAGDISSIKWTELSFSRWNTLTSMEGGGKTIEMWWWWWWGNNRNVVVVVVVGEQ